MASIGEILEEVDALRMRIGPTNAERFPISNEWGDVNTTAALLIQNPEKWMAWFQEKRALDDEETRTRVLRAVIEFSESSYAKISQGARV